MKYCTQCGLVADVAARFCEHCGQAFAAVPPRQPAAGVTTVGRFETGAGEDSRDLVTRHEQPQEPRPKATPAGTPTGPGEKATDTLFRAHARAYQDGHNRTKEQKSFAASLCLGIGAVGIAVLLAFPGAVALFPVLGWAGYFAGRLFVDHAPLIVGGVYAAELLIFGGLTALGVYLLVSAHALPLKKITCPRCGESAEIFASVMTFTCPSCNLLMRLGQGTNAPVELASCAYCGLGTGVTSDTEPFECSNCGLVRRGSSTDVLSDGICERCGRPRPVESLACASCDATTRPNRYQQYSLTTSAKVEYSRAGSVRSYDMDWLAGKDARGHRWFAVALLDLVQATSSRAEGLENMPEAWVALAGAVESLEEACQGEEPAGARAIFATLDRAYRALLAAQLTLIDREPKKAYDKASVKPLARNPHSEARKRLEERYSGLIPTKQRWVADCSVEFAETAMGKYKVKDCSRLREEARRVAAMGGD